VATVKPDPARHGDDSALTPEILKLAAVVVLGAIMTVLDATIVNVALPTLGRDFHTSIATIQWVPTVYMLAFAAMIPLTGWLSERLGVKRLWVLALGMFTVGSFLAGLSWSIGSLIVFRVVQGAGGGVIMPLGQTILARAAGPKRMGRVMSIIGVPLLLAPICGPIIGGALVGAASWRWVFYVNLPVSAIAIVLAALLLPSVPPSRAERLDWPSAVLLCGGIAIALYGLAEIGQAGTLTAAAPLSEVIAGIVLVAAFVIRALRTENPLIDVRLFRARGFAASAATNFVLGVALFGVALLLPLYFQLVRGRTPLETGLLLIPQGLGAACAITPAGILTDKIGAPRIVPVGVLVALAGTAGYTQVQSHTPYWVLSIWLFLIGAGLGATISPSMAAAYQGLSGRAIGRATSAINVVQRAAGSVGSALLAVVLQRAIAADLPSLHGGIAQAAAASSRDPRRVPTALAHAFGTTFWVAFALTGAAMLPALLIPARPRQQSAEPGAGAPGPAGEIAERPQPRAS
jgi:EmrB/QacA subfamily drug resistance transporter